MTRYFKLKKENTYIKVDDNNFNAKDHLIEIDKEKYYTENPRLIFGKHIIHTVQKGMIIGFFLENKQFITFHTLLKTIQIRGSYYYKYYHSHEILMKDKTLLKYCNLINQK